MYATIAGPPKAVAPSLKKDANNRISEGLPLVAVEDDSTAAISGMEKGEKGSELFCRPSASHGKYF